MFPQERKSNKCSKKRKAVTFDDSENEDLDQRQKGKKFCQCYSMCIHTMGNCTMLRALVKQAKQKRNNPFDKKKRFTKHGVNVVVQKQLKKALNQKKRKHT